MSENKTIYYQNGIFSVEDNLFYENHIRIGYFEDEEKEEILENNHKAVVDKLTDLRDSNIDLKRSNKKLRNENKELKQENEQLKEENKELKENVSRLINEAILEILDGQRYEGERILNKALRLLE